MKRQKIINFKLDFRCIARFFPPRKSSLRENSHSPLRLSCGEPWPFEFSRCGSNQVLRFMLLALVISFLSIIAGCGAARDGEDIKKAVLEFEPSFKDVLAKKAQLDSQIDLIMGEFRNKQGEINSKIMELEEELKVLRRQAYSEVRELKARLEPERQRVVLKLNELKTTLKSKEGLLKTLKDSLKETKKFIDTNRESGLLQEEEARWQNNLKDLNSQLPSLEDDIAKLRREVDLYRQELNLLRF